MASAGRGGGSQAGGKSTKKSLASRAISDALADNEAARSVRFTPLAAHVCLVLCLGSKAPQWSTQQGSKPNVSQEILTRDLMAGTTAHRFEQPAPYVRTRAHANPRIMCNLTLGWLH